MSMLTAKGECVGLWVADVKSKSGDKKVRKIQILGNGGDRSEMMVVDDWNFEVEVVRGKMVELSLSMPRPYVNAKTGKAENNYSVAKVQ